MKQEQKSKEVKVGMGVFVLVFNSDYSQLLMVKRNPKKIKRGGVEWGNLGGSLELREYSVDGAMREAREEAGIILEKSKMKLLEVLEFPNWSEEHHGLSFVYGTNIDEKTPIKINDESEGFKWFEINNLPDSMLDPKEFILQAREKAKRLL